MPQLALKVAGSAPATLLWPSVWVQCLAKILQASMGQKFISIARQPMNLFPPKFIDICTQSNDISHLKIVAICKELRSQLVFYHNAHCKTFAVLFLNRTNPPKINFLVQHQFSIFAHTLQAI